MDVAGVIKPLHSRECCRRCFNPAVGVNALRYWCQFDIGCRGPVVRCPHGMQSV